MKGNPANRRKGEVTRALLMSLAGKKAMPMSEASRLVGVGRCEILRQCSILQEKQRIAGYTSAGGILRVWVEDRE